MHYIHLTIPICLSHSFPSSYFAATPPTKTNSTDIVVPFAKLSFVNTRSIDIPDFPLHNIVFQKFRYRIVPARFSFIQCRVQFYRHHNIPRINWFRQLMFSYIIIIPARPADRFHGTDNLPLQADKNSTDTIFCPSTSGFRFPVRHL